MVQSLLSDAILGPQEIMPARQLSQPRPRSRADAMAEQAYWEAQRMAQMAGHPDAGPQEQAGAAAAARAYSLASDLAQRDRQAPTLHQVDQGDEQVTLQWSPADQDWVPIARAPRQRSAQSEFDRVFSTYRRTHPDSTEAEALDYATRRDPAARTSGGDARRWALQEALRERDPLTGEPTNRTPEQLRSRTDEILRLYQDTQAPAASPAANPTRSSPAAAVRPSGTGSQANAGAASGPVAGTDSGGGALPERPQAATPAAAPNPAGGTMQFGSRARRSAPSASNPTPAAESVATGTNRRPQASSPEQQDRVLRMARQALQAGAASEAVRARLQEYGIDPNRL